MNEMVVPSVAVIIPIYNGFDFIDRCLNSVVKQKYANLQIILVDDGSTDHSRVKCNFWAKHYPYIKVYHKENGGLSSARMFGVQHSSADYLMFVDVDDWIADGAIQLLVSTCQKYDTDCVCMNYVPSDGRKILPRSIVAPFSFPDDIVSSSTRCLSHIYERRLGNFVWSFFYKSKLFYSETITFDKKAVFMEDALFVNKMLRTINCVAYIKQPLYYYFQNSHSLTTTKSITKAIAGKRIIDEIAKMPLDNIDCVDFVNYIVDLYFFMFLIACSGNEEIAIKTRKSIIYQIEFEYKRIGFQKLNRENKTKVILLKIHILELFNKLR